MRRILGYVFFAALVVLGLFFGQLNAQRVTLDLHYVALELPLAVIVVGAVLVGVVIGALSVFFSVVLPQKTRIRKLNRQVGKPADEPATPDVDADG